MKIEDAKIKLSNEIGSYAKLADDQSHIEVDLNFAKGEFHPDEDIKIKLTGEDLKSVIRELWQRKYVNIINNTITEAKNKLSSLNFQLNNLDKVVVAGGSSKLPFMKEEIKKVLMTIVNKDNIFMAPYLGRAVAYGLAYEGLEQVTKNPALCTNKIVPCLLNELYIGFKKNRRSSIFTPKIKFEKRILKNGQLISEPFIIDDYTLGYEFEMPFEVNEKVFYYFSDQPQEHSDFTPLNIGHDVFSLINRNKIAKKWKLEIEIQKNGIIKPTFIYIEKGKGAKKGGIRVPLAEFQFQNFNLKEGKSFIGIDFGTSNSYVVKFLKPDDSKFQDMKYPKFEINQNILNKTRELETGLLSLHENKILSKDKLINYSHDQMLKLVFHSNKIEGNPLTQGETEKILKKTTAAKLSNTEREAFNLQNACNWMIENNDVWHVEPEGFLRNLNKMILEGILKENGEYRKKVVKISGVDFKPPVSSSVPSFMEQLSKELKEGLKDRSVVEFATAMHTKFVSIHPFVDGNGRTARLLVNAILLSNNLPPIIVNFADKKRYLAGLEDSNTGNLSALLDFFIECFNESVEDYKNWIDITFEEQAEIDDESISACGFDGNNINSDPIKLAMKEVGADLKIDPIKAAMKPKIEKYEKLMKAEYESWSQGFLILRNELNAIIENFNSTEEYRNAGFKMKLLDYDMISYEKYIDLCNGKKVTRTWFVAFEINCYSKKEKILFFFVNSMRRVPEIKIDPVSLLLARSENGSSRILESEPIRLREVGYHNGQLIFFQSNNEIHKAEVRMNLMNLVADVIKSYL